MSLEKFGLILYFNFQQKIFKYRKVTSRSTSRLVTCLDLQHPQRLDFLYCNMSRLVAWGATNRIQSVFDQQHPLNTVSFLALYFFQSDIFLVGTSQQVPTTASSSFFFAPYRAARTYKNMVRTNLSKCTLYCMQPPLTLLFFYN